MLITNTNTSTINAICTRYCGTPQIGNDRTLARYNLREELYCNLLCSLLCVSSCRRDFDFDLLELLLLRFNLFVYMLALHY
jgi:hypothetical protein